MQRDKGGRTIVGKLAQAGEYVGSIVLFYWLHMDKDGEGGWWGGGWSDRCSDLLASHYKLSH